MSLITPKNQSSNTKNRPKNPFFQPQGTSTFFGGKTNSPFFQPTVSSQNQGAGNQGMEAEEGLVGLDNFQSTPSNQQASGANSLLVPYSFKKTGTGNGNSSDAPLTSPITMGGKSKPNHSPSEKETENGSEVDDMQNNEAADSVKEGAAAGDDGGDNSGNNAGEDTSTGNNPSASAGGSKSRTGGSTNDATNEEGTSESSSPTTAEPQSKPVDTGIIAAYLREHAALFITKGQEKIAQLSSHKKEKKSAATKMEESNKAVAPSANEGQAIANKQLVEQVEARPQPQTNPEKAKSQFNAALSQNLPTKLKEVADFKKNKKAGQITQAVHNVIQVDKDGVLNTYEAIGQQANPVAVPNNAVPIPQIEASKEISPMNLGDQMIANLQTEHTDFSAYQEQVDQKLAAEGLTEEHMDMVDAGELLEVKENQQAIIDSNKNASALVETERSKAINDMNQELTAEELNKKAAMEESRQKGLSEARGLQEQAKTSFETEKGSVNDTINEIYSTAQTSVKTKLSSLESQAFSEFEAAQKEATDTFENNVDARIQAFKKKRYKGLIGKGRWLTDLVLGLNRLPEVKIIMETEKAAYVVKINQTIHNINQRNEATIKECRSIISTAQQDIENYVAQLPTALQNQTAALQAEIQQKLDALDEEINQKEADLKAALEARKEAAIQAINDRIEALNQEMRGRVEKIVDRLANAALKFLRWALVKLGVKDPDRIINTLKKVGEAIKKIIKNPKQFFKNLGAAIGGGFKQFGKNIKENLLDSVGGWLTDKLGIEGFKFPKKFDLKGIFQMVLSFFGISWDSIKGMFSKALGAKLMSKIESGVSLVKGLIEEGPAHLKDMGEEKLKEKVGDEIGQDKMNHITSIVQLVQAIRKDGMSALWDFFKNNGGGLKDKLSGKVGDIKKTVVAGVKKWAITSLIKKAITKIATLLNPVTGLLQTINSIYQTIKFFLDNREGLKNLVQSIIGALGKVVDGDVGGASGDIFNAIMQGIKLLLDFFVKLLNLNNFFDAIKKAIEKVVKVVNDFIQTIVTWIADLVKGLLEKLKKWFEKMKEKITGKYDPEKEAKVQAGITKIEELTEVYQESDSTISRENAEKVVQETKAAPEGQIFSSLKVTDEKNEKNWDFVFTASPATHLSGRKKKEGENGELQNSQGTVVIDVPKQEDVEKVLIHNTDGDTFYNKPLEEIDENITFHNIPNGLYFLTFVYKNGQELANKLTVTANHLDIFLNRNPKPSKLAYDMNSQEFVKLRQDIARGYAIAIKRIAQFKAEETFASKAIGWKIPNIPYKQLQGASTDRFQARYTHDLYPERETDLSLYFDLNIFAKYDMLPEIHGKTEIKGIKCVINQHQKKSYTVNQLVCGAEYSNRATREIASPITLGLKYHGDALSIGLFGFKSTGLRKELYDSFYEDEYNKALSGLKKKYKVLSYIKNKYNATEESWQEYYNTSSGLNALCVI